MTRNVQTRQPRLRRWTAPAGAGLIARGFSGFCPVNYAAGRTLPRDDTRRALGGHRGIHVHESITINRPVHEVYRHWRDFSNLAAFMHHVERVDVIDQRRSHWVVRGPAGRTGDGDIMLSITSPPILRAAVDWVAGVAAESGRSLREL